MRIKAVLSLIVLGVILSLSLLNFSCISDKQINNYADNFVSNLNKETTTIDNMNSDYFNSDISTTSGLITLQGIITKNIRTFNEISDSYQAKYPDSAPQSLKDAVNLARTGTTKIITGLNSLNNTLTLIKAGQNNSAQDQFEAAGTIVDEGIAAVSQSVSKYNDFVATYNTSKTSTPWGLGILIGTGVIFGLNFLVIGPIIKYLTKRKITLVPVVDAEIAGQVEPKVETDPFSSKYFIPTSVAVMGIAGFLMGFLIGWYFIGIAWKKNHWPGMIAFIGMSLLGSFLF
jgi:hypothetical protein